MASTPTPGDRVVVTTFDGRTHRPTGIDRGIVASINPFGVADVLFDDGSYCQCKTSELTIDVDDAHIADPGSHELRSMFVVASDRAEHEPCERGTDGCCVDHAASPRHDSCETW